MFVCCWWLFVKKIEKSLQISSPYVKKIGKSRHYEFREKQKMTRQLFGESSAKIPFLSAPISEKPCATCKKVQLQSFSKGVNSVPVAMNRTQMTQIRQPAER